MKHQWKLIVALILGFIGAILDFVMHMPHLTATIIDIAALLMALSMLKEMIMDLKAGHWGVDILAIIAVISTVAVNEFWAAWMILVMLTGGESLEDYATSQADKELRSLLSNNPRLANKVVDGVVSEVKVDDLKIGDHVLVKPGSQVPVDGIILTGSSSFDESSLTGESVPVEKGIDDTIMSGSINGDSAITMQVTKLAKDSEYQTIVALVQSSEAAPAKFVKMADRYAVPFTIISLIIGISAWISSGDPTRFAQVMVVASPCPLLIAAPVALVSGMSSMSKNHISGTVLEKLSRAKTFAFDKTGTLTRNQLVIDQIVPEKGFNKEELQIFAASVEQASSHIIATSLVKATPKAELHSVTDLEEVTGQGVRGKVADKIVCVGKLSFVAPDKNLKNINSTAIYISIDNKFGGYITFADQIRPETPDTISSLRAQGAQHIMMLTGDNSEVAQKVAAVAGVDDVRSSLLPAEKIAAVKGIKSENRPVVMTGDGVNDAPSLMAADVGIAMGAKGATAASESADAVIMVNDLSKVSDAVAIAKHTMKVANIDVLTAISIVILIEIVAFTGIIPAMAGAILQEVVDLITICLALLAKTTPKIMRNKKTTNLQKKTELRKMFS
ncbi:cadmium-translocating P-type ATPase [Lactobacillus mulieris]|uniref:heavy metal translocating P-type ATPase n=1 Tax=Lactobacillus mulieris TaxID=2508708 RepID=UPI0022CDF7BB|nr:heavy metal translocating P-type ATPase [Lactobacillus mulieris]MCZ9600538.1 cadmium-translocating P-type ATPase [Lactobacillus mulieris]